MGGFVKALGCCCPEEPPPCCFCDRAWEHDSWSIDWNSVLSDGVFDPAETPDPLNATNCNYRDSEDCYEEAEVSVVQQIETDTGWIDGPTPTAGGGLSNNICPPCHSCAYGTSCPEIEVVLNQFSNRTIAKINVFEHARWKWTVEQTIGDFCDEVKFKATLQYRVIRFVNKSTFSYGRNRNYTYTCPGPNDTINFHLPGGPTIGAWNEPTILETAEPSIWCDGEVLYIDGPSGLCTPPSGTEPVEDCAKDYLPATYRRDTINYIAPCNYSVNVVEGSYNQRGEEGGCNCSFYACDTVASLMGPGPAEYGYNEFWESASMPCSEFPCEIELTRRFGLPAENVTVASTHVGVFSGGDFCDYDPAPDHVINIPATITLNLTPCEDV